MPTKYAVIDLDQPGTKPLLAASVSIHGRAVAPSRAASKGATRGMRNIMVYDEQRQRAHFYQASMEDIPPESRSDFQILNSIQQRPKVELLAGSKPYHKSMLNNGVDSVPDYHEGRREHCAQCFGGRL